MSFVFSQIKDGYDRHKLKQVFEAAIKTNSLFSLLECLEKLSRFPTNKTVAIYARDPWHGNELPFLHLSFYVDDKFVGTGVIQHQSAPNLWILKIM
jgi:hypothetical protein